MDSFSSLGFSTNAFSPLAFDFDEEAAAGTPAEPSDISVIFAADHSRLHLLPNEIRERRRLWLKRQRDKALEEKMKRRRRELELVALYALVREAA